MFTEKEYKEAIKICKEQFAQLGYVVPSITQFKSTTRMTRANGNHRYRRNTVTGEVVHSIITLSQDLNKDIMGDTLMHEMIHALYPLDGHGYEFQRMARLVNKTYGYKIGTYANSEVSKVVREARQARLTRLQCNNCGTVYTLKPRSKILQHALLGLCTCTHCKGKEFTKV